MMHPISTLITMQMYPKHLYFINDSMPANTTL